MPDPNSSRLMDGDTTKRNSREEIYHLMGRVKEQLDLLGLEQFNAAHMIRNPNEKVVECIPMKDGYPMFNLLFGLDDPYTAVVARIAEKLQVAADRIKLTGHICCTNEPNYHGLGHQFHCLRDVLKKIDMTICDVLYYDVLDAYLPRKSMTVTVAYGSYPNAEQRCVAVRPKHITVEDLLHDKEVVKLTNSNAKLRLVGTSGDTICKVFSPEEKIENIPEYFTLRVEGIPNMEELGYWGHDVICRAHKFLEEEHSKEMCLHHDETLAVIKARRQKKCLKMRNFPRWLNKLEMLKRRGKGAPKNGRGRRTNATKTWGEGDVLDNPKRLRGRTPFLD